MNSKIMDKSNIKLSTYTDDKSIANNKILNNITKSLHFIFATLISDKKEYNYDRNSKYHSYNDITDTTELKLIASRRTFS
ncbi:hypothetical protein GKZ28_12025 [Clostridium chromiireducens]|uniref:Uncharacterized protein n=1 Tax=Clostridium chromiireducens TaxID=225345 RepID=A0A964W2S1_9CLOT|nr:hypothetical protein [Clostridium chromiireducens]MVX64418.1 hypothetical protein [Clostridium chromiireducens]